jgi:hypothetical protein
VTSGRRGSGYPAPFSPPWVLKSSQTSGSVGCQLYTR